MIHDICWKATWCKCRILRTDQAYFPLFPNLSGMEILRGVLANILDYDIIISEFELKSRYYVHIRTNLLRKGMNTFIPQPAMVEIIPLLLFYKNGLGFKWPTKVDIPLDKETKNKTVGRALNTLTMSPAKG